MAAQGEFALAETRFGDRLAALVKAEREKTGKCTYERLAEIAEEELARTIPPEKLVRARRDELFVSLVRACGIEPAAMPKDAARLAASSLAQIVKVMPGLDRPEIERRVRRYRAKYPGVTVTPRGVMLNWALLDGPKETRKPDLYTPPPDWQARVLALPFDGERMRELAAGTFNDLPLTVREQICK